jgi:transposase
MKLRTTTTSSGNTAVQVIERANHKTIIIKHIGSAKNEEELQALYQLGRQYMHEHTPTIPLFPKLISPVTPQHLIALENLEFIRTYHQFAYEFFSYFYQRNGFDSLANPIVKDLAIIRLIEPVSKIASLSLLKEHFGLTHGHDQLYQSLQSLVKQKEQVENQAIGYAQQALSFDFSLVFYDVTTLYFETFKEDADTIHGQAHPITGLRKNGFGKEHKPGQPQILIGLLVTREGYPVKIELFTGKTFEGHTLIPVITQMKQQHSISTLTVVADAAMLSIDNMQALQTAKLSYIVGARLGNITHDLLAEISNYLNKTEGKYYVTETKWGTLICTYSDKRASKDRSDRKKQLDKSNYQVHNPNQVKRKARFVTETTKAVFTINEELVKQDQLREGIKGYYTNLELNERLTAIDIVARYHDLWHVEKAFRITKSDLEARPVFHHKQETIQAHILIVFISLCIAKSIELLTKLSIKKVTKYVWPILDIEFFDTLSKQTFKKRMKTVENPMVELWKTFKNST